MKVSINKEDAAAVSLDVVPGAYVYLSTPDQYHEWHSLTKEQQAAWLAAERIISEAVSKAVALIQLASLVQVA